MKTGNYSYGVLTNGIRWNFHLFKMENLGKAMK